MQPVDMDIHMVLVGTATDLKSKKSPVLSEYGGFFFNDL
jgi:hypothetical protein